MDDAVMSEDAVGYARIVWLVAMRVTVKRAVARAYACGFGDESGHACEDMCGCDDDAVACDDVCVAAADAVACEYACVAVEDVVACGDACAAAELRLRAMMRA